MLRSVVAFSQHLFETRFVSIKNVLLLMLGQAKRETLSIGESFTVELYILYTTLWKINLYNHVLVFAHRKMTRIHICRRGIWPHFLTLESLPQLLPVLVSFASRSCRRTRLMYHASCVMPYASCLIQIEQPCFEQYSLKF